MKKITDYFHKKETDLVFIQAKIPRSIYDALKVELEKRKISWNKYLIAVSKRFLDEMKREE